MQCLTSSTRLLAAVAGLALLAGCDSDDDSITIPISSLNVFNRTTLVADAPGHGARTIDANLVNPWGLAFGPTGALWVANNGTGTATLYDAVGNILSPVVTIPGSPFPAAGQPTGVVFNSTGGFAIAGGSAAFIFAGLDGIISAWNPSSNSAQVVVDRSANGSVYTGIAIAASGGFNQLYAADFVNGQVDIFDESFALLGSFTDPTLPSDYGPFGIQNVNGKLFVAYAKRDPATGDEVKGAGNGYVVVFNSDGSVSTRFASNGTLNAPWAIALAPSGFGPFGGAILIGNFGDGTIGVFNPSTGAFIDVLRDVNQVPIYVDGLWGLTFGPGAASTRLYFAGGIDDETHGIVGVITPP